VVETLDLVELTTRENGGREMNKPMKDKEKLAEIRKLACMVEALSRIPPCNDTCIGNSHLTAFYKLRSILDAPSAEPN